LCEETFEERLKICIDMYQRTSQGKVETSYEIVKDKQSVERECRRRNMTFTQIFESGESKYVANDTIRNVTFEVNMFACPITKMDLRYPVEWLEPELFDMYISLGRNDVTVSALRDSVHLDNICVRDTYLFPPPGLRESRPRFEPFWPEEIRNYDEMDEAYFEKLASKVYSRRMATATGEDVLTTVAMFTQSTAVIPGTIDSTTGDETCTSPEDTFKEVPETISHTKATKTISNKKPSEKTKSKKAVTKKTIKARKTSSKTTNSTPKR
jgi:hypothetical protein